ncbi:nitrate- and nitrite sensing domain-containing protein [Actinomadura barringtoniae]|uniref:histidine kinase n=1 Tax=Actinomadura barringtoniae TaxID=1427535 RepID=A0A939T639_9ACTN|nr:nitrate- and nitrite sensing domain-containing protein [Actinomadura barringtoniae]MBO2451433.1 nitrate- and nitrite sensing domain-containing protein [Actinomadura barringtoniae]
MRFRNSRLRTKVTALLLSLIALWGFAAWVTLREGINLLGVQTLDSNVAQPSDPLLVELQRERRLSMVEMATPGQQQRSALQAQRARTDQTASELVSKARSGAVKRTAGDDLEHRINLMISRLRTVNAARHTVDSGGTDRAQVSDAYTGIIDAVFRTYDALATLDDKDFARDTRSLVAINRTWELLSQEDALAAGALATGRVSATEQAQFTELVGARRITLARALADVENSDPTLHDNLQSSPKLARVRAFEDQIIQARRAVTSPQSAKQQRPVVSAEQWSSAAAPALADVRDQVQGAGDRLVDRAKPIAIGVVVRLLLAGGLGLLAVIASIVVSITTARALVRQLERLRGAAWELAEQRLPGVVERLGHGESVDVATEAPPLEFGADEIGQVGKAFNAVQETAIRTAVEQAELRRGIRDVLLSLARRTQTLVHRQLSMLDTMERRQDIDPKELQDLFRIDHLATRMRRNAENLIVLSGAIPARGWRRSVPMVDVVRAAVGEVEDYTRVQVMPIGAVELTGRAVGDVTHLLAELIENAVSFSPPDTVVQIGGQKVASGFAIDIEDRGLGMSDERLNEINERIADPPEFNLQSSVQLGLFVVGRLAERYGLQVSLKRSAYGGTTAVVVIPTELVTDEGDRPPGLPATTENGLAVRQPATAGARALAAVPSTSRDSSGSGGLKTVPQPRPETEDEEPEVLAGTVLPAESTPTLTPTPVESALAESAPVESALAEPAPVEPVEQPDTTVEEPEVSSTPSGLPVRVPQASLAPPLRTEEPVVAEEPDEEEAVRSPEEIQRIMGSYQAGTRRGRDEAQARAEGEDEQ